MCSNMQHIYQNEDEPWAKMVDTGDGTLELLQLALTPYK